MVEGCFHIVFHSNIRTTVNLSGNVPLGAKRVKAVIQTQRPVLWAPFKLTSWI